MRRYFQHYERDEHGYRIVTVEYQERACGACGYRWYVHSEAATEPLTCPACRAQRCC